MTNARQYRVLFGMREDEFTGEMVEDFLQVTESHALSVLARPVEGAVVQTRICTEWEQVIPMKGGDPLANESASSNVDE